MNRKSRVSYLGPGFLSSATWPLLPKKHYNGLINQPLTKWTALPRACLVSILIVLLIYLLIYYFCWPVARIHPLKLFDHQWFTDIFNDDVNSFILFITWDCWVVTSGGYWLFQFLPRGLFYKQQLKCCFNMVQYVWNCVVVFIVY